MSNKKEDCKAQICWLPKEQGGRIVLPTNPMFAANCRFEDDNSLWSVAIFRSENQVDVSNYEIVGLGFPFIENIKERIAPGKKIYIFEGPEKLIGEGIIISISRSG